MALLACPECGRSVSSAATSCPHCGNPLGAGRLAVPAGSQSTERVLWEGTPSAKALVGAIAGATLFALVLGLGAYLAYRPLLTLAAGLSPDARRWVDHHRDDVFLVVVGLVVLLILGRLLRLGWRLAVLKSHRYRITD